MLTYLTPAAETFTAAEEAEWAERREALAIRSLVDDADLRRALGLAPIAAHGAETKPGKRVPTRSSAPATNRRTKTAGKQSAGAHARLNRRILLESDR